MSVTPKTTPNASKKSASKRKTKERKASFADIGGLDHQISLLRELIEIPVKQKSFWASLGLKLPRGVLLHGPSGTGKTLLARALSTEMSGLGVNSVAVSTLEALSSPISVGAGDIESHLVRAFSDARGRSPCLVFIDNLETLCPKFETGNMSIQESKAVGALVNLIDELDESDSVVFLIATCTRPDLIPPVLRRPGRFDKEIYIPVPASAPFRLQIFDVLTKSLKHSLSRDECYGLCQQLHGFVGADMDALCFEAGLQAHRRFMQISEDMRSTEEFFITFEDFISAKRFVKPSALREVQLEVPKVLWADIGGQTETKRRLKESVELPLKYPHLFTKMGIIPPRGILLFGPPGCSKTLIAQAVATESGLNFIAVKGPELFSKWVGESERALREIFDRARTSAPSVIFIDEIDAIASARGSAKGGTNVGDRVLATFLNEMDGVESLTNVVVVAATNRPDVIDKALMRPGRLDRIIYVPLPDPATRREIFLIRFRRTPVSDEVMQGLDELVNRTDGFSGAEVTALCQEAALSAVEQYLNLLPETLETSRSETSSVPESAGLSQSTLVTGLGNISLEADAREPELDPSKTSSVTELRTLTAAENIVVKMLHFRKAMDAVKPRTTQQMVEFYRNFSAQNALNSAV